MRARPRFERSGRAKRHYWGFSEVSGRLQAWSRAISGWPVRFGRGLARLQKIASILVSGPKPGRV